MTNSADAYREQWMAIVQAIELTSGEPLETRAQAARRAAGEMGAILVDIGSYCVMRRKIEHLETKLGANSPP